MPVNPVTSISPTIPLAASAGTTLPQLSEHEEAVQRKLSQVGKLETVNGKERRELLDKLSAQLALIRARIAQMEAARSRAEKARDMRQHARGASPRSNDPANRDPITGLSLRRSDPIDDNRDPITGLHPHPIGAEVAFQAVDAGTISIQGPANTTSFGDLPPGMLLDIAL